ncbi:hypothetical protein PRUPE_1G044200 [Prunus persica]|uniref:Uncharacterized protein n=1 Tax=Prunus persica TaxID=3760 RepID=A0A251QSM7_PRUPE|nr:hypothetical protein PRUPE_1G044200 [Prunus persica]
MFFLYKNFIFMVLGGLFMTIHVKSRVGHLHEKLSTLTIQKRPRQLIFFFLLLLFSTAAAHLSLSLSLSSPRSARAYHLVESCRLVHSALFSLYLRH